MQLVVVDVESTGLEDTDQVCELALVTLGVESSTKDRGKDWKDKWQVTGAWSSLVKPSCPISIPARATHHITDAELKDARSMPGLLLKRGFPEFGVTSTGGPLVSDPIFCAHNAEFDRRMLVQSGVHPSLLPAKTICTWRCALHLYPDSPVHSNQVLRYYLEVEPETTLGVSLPHRALPDALVTAAILCRMLELESAERLVELTSTPVLLSKVSFGQHRGKYWRDLDVGMLRWVLSKDFKEDEKFTAKYWLDEKTGCGNG